MAALASVPSSAITLWILEVGLKGVVILLLVLAAAQALPRSSAGLRHLLWSAGITAVLLVPVVSLVLPWELAVVPLPQAVAVQASRLSQAPPPVPVGAGEHLQGDAGPLTDQRSPAPGSVPAGRGALLWLFAAWAAGAVFFLGRLALGAFLLRRVVGKAVPLTSTDWSHPLIEGADRLGVDRLPRLLMSDQVPMPVVWGALAPAIVLPAGAAEWTDRRRRAVLCHELAHIRRFDLVTNLLSRWACALYWFNPLVWIAARQLRAESERAADDLVLGVGTRASEYADHLLQIVCGAQHSHAPEVAIPMAQRREFEGRMLAILDEEATRESPSRTQALGLAALSLLLLLPITAMAPAVAGQGEAALGEVTGDSNVSPSMLAALLGGLEEASPGRRTGAAEALGTLRASAGVGALGWHLIRDADPRVRITSAWALGQIASPQAMDPLMEAALRDADEQVRAMAAWALGQVADPVSLSKLDAILGDPVAEVRLRAAWAIGNTPSGRIRGSLVEALGDPDYRVAEMAAWALGQIRDPEAVPALDELLGNGEEMTKPGLAALWALACIGGDAAREPLTRALEWKNPDKKLMDAMRLALAGQPVAPPSRDWPIAAAELHLKGPSPVAGESSPR